MPDLSTAPEIERMTMALGAREMSPPGFIQAKRAKRAAPIPTASPASPLWRAAALECVVAEELADPDPDPAGLVLVEVAGLIIRWLVSHAGKTKPKIIVLGSGRCCCRSDGGSVGGGSSSNSSSASTSTSRGTRSGETGSVGFSKLALDLDDRKSMVGQ